MKQTSLILLALVAVNASALERKRVLRWRNPHAESTKVDGDKLVEFDSLFDVEGAAAEAMAAFGRLLQSSSSNSLPAAVTTTAPPTAAPKTSAPTSSPTASPTDPPTEAPTTSPTTPPEDETPAQITEPTDTDTTEDEVIVETKANGSGVAIPLLSVLGVIGIASLVVARRSYLASAAGDTDSASSDSEAS